MSIKETGSTYFSVKGDELPQVYHPWRRYLARIFDIIMYNVLWSIFLGLTFNVNLATRSNWGNLLDTFLAIAIMLVMEPLWLRLLGNTPGKIIFGLRIEKPDGRHLSYVEGLKRTWGVIGMGMGYNIPIYNFVCLWKSYKLCSEKEVQPWDESVVYTLKDTKWYRGLLYIGAHVAVFAVLFTIMSAQRLPPNRGDLTVAEFVENYNYYAEFFGVDFGNEFLDENGSWTEKEINRTIHIVIGKTEKPEYHFTTENGYVTEVSFEIEIENREDWLGSYNTHIILNAIAFAGAQNEMGLFSKIPHRIEEQIRHHTFKDFHFEEAGITFVSDTEYSGYEEWGFDFLVPKGDANENYFKLDFSMSKQNTN
ncbi:RDD family protein [Natranaerovirga hydrolytica]|uniref:RDD family protein n=1 Tax=Natranaerovirga hydrolytica TaxID=680378 RepID=A0A4V2Q098_9FIRM|nr:RDD family protein [Natranaerovirga hydrolytica]TCK92911.1 RDD family protein [Natranaerovirga hydrolytica]